jgi:hypothetical protein
MAFSYDFFIEQIILLALSRFALTEDLGLKGDGEL